MLNSLKPDTHQFQFTPIFRRNQALICAQLEAIAKTHAEVLIECVQ